MDLTFNLSPLSLSSSLPLSPFPPLLSLSLSLPLSLRYIDLDRVISVQEVSAAQQDKNHATFLVQCDGRTYQLQAHDEATMRK